MAEQDEPRAVAGLQERGFQFDAASFANSRLGAEERVAELEPRFIEEDVSLPESDILAAVEERALDLMAGRLPEDIQREVTSQIEQITAERSLAQGLGLGQAALNLTFRDIGASVFEVSQAGTSIAAALGELETRTNLATLDLNTRREVFNSETQLRYDTLREQMRQFDDSFAAIMAETDVNVDRLKLASFELISQNQRVSQQLSNDLIINNSRQEIEGGREALENLQDFFFTTNEGILRGLGLEP